MVRILIVDDEREIRNGLVTQIPWSEWGVDEVLDADDGDTALEVALRRRPDLIVTDIRMPRMSGLRLIEALVRERYDGSLIVVSGFDDFHYAKEAFKLGVSDYLLKPLDKEDLFKAVTVALQRQREKHASELSRSLIRQGYESAVPKIREELLRQLIGRPYREDPAARTEHKLGQLGLDWLLASQLRLAVIGIDSLKALTIRPSAVDKDALLAEVGGILSQTIKTRHPGSHVLFRSEEDDWIAILEQAASDMAEPYADLLEDARERIGSELEIRVDIGEAVGRGGLGQLSDLYRRAMASLVGRRLQGSEAAEEAPDAGGGYERPEYQLANPRELVEILKYGTEKDIREAMAGFPKLAKSWEAKHPKDLQQRTFEWLLDIFRTAQKTAGWKETSWEKHPIALWEHLERFDTLESLRQQATEQLLKAGESIKAQSGSRSQIVHEAQRIIHQRFQENLTLQMVAEHVHVTPVWLSKLFKKETDMNFLEYLTDVRLQKAADQLGDLRYKVYQISYMVGYQDPVHFSKLFKRTYGCTPQEYRNSRSIRHE
ncbi:response regulator transcription factor [Cohnella sp. JJ-181]|uniref:response regulator transcription factor n=1 Tax=Cohnella rhizoplanae TaxID=2974897 RepID=UPI0022FFA7B1|nr:response regulator [Cohnella sp. JJ-181]CAI6080158.1 Regulator of RpoS [Cohnella sp. JJ-181]